MSLVTLRPAALADADFLYSLRTDPESVKASLLPPPTPEQHATWLQRTLDNDAVALYVAEELGVPVGTGRLDFGVGGGTALLSVTVAAAHRHGGVGREVIGLLCEQAKYRGIARVRARVKGMNAPSLRAFLACGFVVDQPDVVVTRESA